MRNKSLQFIDDRYEYLPIDSIEFVDEPMKMIDIEVEDDHTFCITDLDIITHNCNNMIKSFTIPSLRTNTPVIITNHVYADPSAMFPSKIMNQSGGSGVQYMARITIQCSKRFEKSAPTDKNFYKATILKFFSVKNSMVKPFYETEMYLDFSEGPHRHFGLLKSAMAYGFIVSPTKGFYVVPSFGEKKMRLREILDDPAIWETFLKEYNVKSIEEMSYSGGKELDDLSDDMLEEGIGASEDQEESA